MKPPTIASRLSLALIAVATLIPATSFASQATQPLTVNVAVENSCTISTTQEMVFGNYDAIVVNATAPLTSTASVSVTCAPGTYNTSADLDISSSPNKVAGYNFAMAGPGTGGSSLLGYDLSWTSPATNNYVSEPLTGITDGSPHTETIYGAVGAGQNVPVGTYSDNINVLVNF